MSAETILHRLQTNATNLSNAPAYYVKQGEAWVATSWKTYSQEVRQAARALITLGVEPGGIVTILGFNSAEWVITDLAAMLMGGAAAGIYATNSPAEVKYIVEHAESRVILVENEAQWEKIKAVREDIACLHHVVMMKKGPAIADDMVLSWEDFMAKGDETPDALIDERLAALQQDQLATLIYTSGTTGPPKAVMLSHRNLAWTAKQAVDLLKMNPADSLLSYLPLSHIAEQMFSIHSAVTSGYPIYFAESNGEVARQPEGGPADHLLCGPACLGTLPCWRCGATQRSHRYTSQVGGMGYGRQQAGLYAQKSGPGANRAVGLTI